MIQRFPPESPLQSENQLVVLSFIIAIAALINIIYTQKPMLPKIFTVIIPLGVSVSLGLLTVRRQEKGADSTQTEKLVKYGWGGTLISAAICGWMIVLHYYHNMPISWLFDQVLIIVSAGLGSGVLIGKSVMRNQKRHVESTQPVVYSQGISQADEDSMLAETTWINRSGSDPILEGVIEVLADIEDVDQLELEPLYNHINTDVFSQLQQQENSRWQLLFHTDEHEIHINSFGIIAVYEIESSEDASDNHPTEYT